MKKLPLKKANLWGEAILFHPYLLEYIEGNGEQVIWFEYMEDRPRYYIVRVGSNINLDDMPANVVASIREAILAESMEFMTDTQYADHADQGYFNSDDRPWPIPPLEMPCGYSWGTLQVDVNDVKFKEVD